MKQPRFTAEAKANLILEVSRGVSTVYYIGPLKRETGRNERRIDILVYWIRYINRLRINNRSPKEYYIKSNIYVHISLFHKLPGLIFIFSIRNLNKLLNKNDE